MCRLYLQYNVNNVDKNVNEENIFKFLQYDSAKNTDGFGFCWYNNVTQQWSIYKNCILYNEDPDFNKKINQIINANVIIGHIRSNKHKLFLSNDIYNTHPFIYKNQIFCHNGGTRKLPNLSIHNSIKLKINKKYIPLINGFTTSELLFYLFLTIKDDVIDSKNFALYDEILVESFNLMISYIEYIPLKILANIIFSDSNFIIIAKYKTNILDSEKIKSLFYVKTDNDVLISSSNIFYNMENFTDNSIMTIDIKSGLIKQYPIKYT